MNRIQMMGQELLLELPTDPLEDFVRIPGVFRRWEIEQVIDDDTEYRVEAAGELSDKTRVFAVYRRDRRALAHTLGTPVTLVFDTEGLAIRAQVMRLDEEGTHLVAMASGDSPEDRAAFTRIRELLGKAEATADLEPAASTSSREAAP